MTVKELTLTDNYEIVHLGDPEAVISEPYCCDLLSIAMGNAPAASAWCTVMSNMNTLAVASLTECVADVMIHRNQNAWLHSAVENSTVHELLLQWSVPFQAEKEFRTHSLLSGLQDSFCMNCDLSVQSDPDQ